MRSIVIFCQAYDYIEDVLSIIMRYWHSSCSITLVIIYDHDLFKFFGTVNNKVLNNRINLIYFKRYEPEKFCNVRVLWVIGYFVNILREKRALQRFFDEYLAQFTKAEIFFFGRSFSQYIYYFARKLAGKNTLIYMFTRPDLLGVFAYKHFPRNIPEFLTLIRLKLVYGLGITMASYRGSDSSAFAYMPDRFFKNKFSQVITHEEREQFSKNLDLSNFKKVFEVDEYKVIYLDDDLCRTDYIPKKDTLRKELVEIFGILRKYFSEKQIAMKYPPLTSPETKVIIEHVNVIDQRIPAEFLFRGKGTMYLGGVSNSLANIEEGLAVSLIDLISFKTDVIREMLRQMLIARSRSHILFPESLEEFEKIVAEFRDSLTK